ncbi:MAG: hypothetical protein ACTSP3_05880 [Candidatus Heimdallarchaeaceae archaeon]
MSKEKTGIFVTIRFWTDFENKKGKKEHYEKIGWAAGTLYLRASEFHGIKADKPIVFNNLEEFHSKLDQLLRNQEITLMMQDEKGKLIPRLGKGYPKRTWEGHE